jgi:hypothetical protein
MQVGAKLGGEHGETRLIGDEMELEPERTGCK